MVAFSCAFDADTLVDERVLFVPGTVLSIHSESLQAEYFGEKRKSGFSLNVIGFLSRHGRGDNSRVLHLVHAVCARTSFIPCFKVSGKPFKLTQ